MLRGLYSAASGMFVQMDRQDAIANNLANINTPGFRRTAVGVSAFNVALQTAGMTTAASPATSCIIPFSTTRQDLRPGSVQDTGNPTNLALDGPGYFVVQDGGVERLVRGGNFRLDNSGRLVGMDGNPVLGDRGPIQVSGGNISVDADGNVHSGKAVVDKLRVVDAAGNTVDKTTRVVAGSLEGSNTNAVEEMVNMIGAMRAYEACQRTIQSLDQTLDKAVNQLGRTA